MYNPDAVDIARFALSSAHAVARVGIFVLATINQHFERVPFLLAEYDRVGASTRHFMGWQARAVRALVADRDRVYRDVASWPARGKSAGYYALRSMVARPGFGIVKAAFFVQLVLPGTHIGCLDRHNLRMYGLSPAAFKSLRTSLGGVTGQLNRYSALCRKLGGSAHLWDTWCAHLAALRPHIFASAEHVSQLHVRCIMGGG